MPPATICELIEEAGARLPDHVALQMYSDDGEVRYTYRQFLLMARNLSIALKQRGIKKGDRIAIWARLEPKFVIACLGILYCGGVVVPLDVEYGSDEVASILADTECNLIFAAREKIPIIEQIAGNLPRELMLVVLDSARSGNAVIEMDELLRGDNNSSTLPSNSPEDIAIIFYTSGTTGKPKGVVIQHQSINNSVRGVQQYVNLSPEDRLIAIIPPHHILATLANIFVPLVNGTSVTYTQTVKSIELLKIIQRAKITVFPAVPQIFYMLHQKVFDELRQKPLALRVIFRILLHVCYWLRRVTTLNLGRWVFARVHKAFGGHLRLLISAASYFDPRVINDLYSLGFTILQGYALTETFGGGTITPFYQNELGSVGRPIPGVKLKIVEPDETGTGEIAISGPSLMQGYFKDPESTAQVLKDGWFHTGDMGYRDAKGNYYITGRQKEMIVLSSGKKVYPEEVENHYLQSPYIKEMCLLGDTDSSDYARSERLHAIIIPDFDYLRQERVVNSKEIIRDEIERLSSQLPKYKRILAYDVQAKPLPRTTTKKIMRWVVQKQHTANRRSTDVLIEDRYSLADGDDLLLATKESKVVLDLIRTGFHIQQDLHPDMNLELNLGFDSLQRIELIAGIEQLLNIHLSDETASQFLTVRDLLKAVNLKPLQSESATVGSPSPEHSPWKGILSSSSADDIAERYVLRSSHLIYPYFILLKLIYLLAKLLFKLEVRGLANIPQQRPYLICPNHQSYLDGVLIFSALPYNTVKHLFSVGHTPYFNSGLKALIARLTKIVPIDPDTNLIRAMKISAIGLKAKKILLIFPEGTRTYNGELQPFKKGAAILARELNAPVLPVAIDGAFNVWSKASGRIRLVPIKITIGQLLYLGTPETSPYDHEKDYTHIAQKMHDEVKNLLSHGQS